MKRILFLVLFAVLSFNQLSAQTKHETSAWFMFVNATKFNTKWGLHFDAQLRSGDDLKYLKNVLIRPGLTYYINKNSNATVGYLLNTTNVENSSDNLIEHRIWEQYIVNHKLSSIFASHRLRLEQRFIDQNVANDVFSQRFRYFFRLIQPLQKQQDTFAKGAFVALQNEIFLNIQNKDQLNGRLFDQNRLYLAAGYRFSPKLDIEAGYLNQAINGRTSNTVNNVIQLALYTRF